jgi:hypothetical protein
MTWQTMLSQTDRSDRRVHWLRVIAGGLGAGLLINIFEYGGHRFLLNAAWTAAFRVLGKAPMGWIVFIPANFVVGILMVWFFARLRLHYGAGIMNVWRAGLTIWAVFWVVPMTSMMPMGLFPNGLLFTVIALGFLDVNLAALLGAWLYERV